MKSLKTILASLIARTRDRSVDWETLHSSQFLLKIGNTYTIRIMEWDENDLDGAGYSLFLNREDVLIDRIVASSEAVEFNDLQQLFDSARRNAYKIDEAIDDIEQFLKNSKIPF